MEAITVQRSSSFKVRIGDSNDLSFPVDELRWYRGGGRGKKGLPWTEEERVSFFLFFWKTEDK